MGESDDDAEAQRAAAEKLEQLAKDEASQRDTPDPGGRLFRGIVLKSDARLLGKDQPKRKVLGIETKPRRRRR